MPNFVPFDPSVTELSAADCAPPRAGADAFRLPNLPSCGLTSGGALPKVGSPEWCACLTQLRAWFATVGNSAFDWLFPSPNEAQSRSFWSALIHSINPINKTVDGLKQLAAALSDQGAAKIDRIIDAIRDMLRGAQVCNPAELIGIELCRTLLNALQNVRIGTDALIWLTVDLRLTISILERILTYVANHACPVDIPSVSESQACYVTATAPEGLLRCWSEMQGADWDVWRPVRDAMRRKPEVQELFTLRNREFIDDSVLNKQLRILGFTDAGERAGMPQLRFEVPGPSDLVRFAVRHVFEPDLIAEFGYNDEYRPILDAFHHAQGVDYPIFTGPLKDVVTHTEQENNLAPGTFAQQYAAQHVPEPTWARAYWWSHWVLPSRSDGQEMFFRLDPTRDKQGEPEWMKEQNFDLEHLRLLLRANDYPPYWRDKLAAIAYRPPNLRFLRAQIQTKTINHAQAVSQLRQMGFRPDYAEIQATTTEIQLARQEAEKLLKIVLAHVQDAWEIGIVDDQTFVNDLVTAGIPTEEANAHLLAAVAKREVDIAKKLTSYVHQAFIRGTFSWTQADQFLTQIGINQRRRGEYKIEWGAERQARRKEATVQQLIKAVLDNALTVPDLAQRLRNLDYTDNAISLILVDVRSRVVQAQARALKQLAADVDRTQRQRAAAARAADTALKNLRSELAGGATKSQLKTWYCDGSLTAKDAHDRMALLGVPRDDIYRWFAECDAKRIKAGLPTYAQETTGSQA